MRAWLIAAACFFAVTAGGQAATRACDQNVVYAKYGVRVAQKPDKRLTACLGRDKAYALGTGRPYTVHGHQLIYAQGETFHQLDLRTGRRRVLGFSHPRSFLSLTNLTDNGTVAFISTNLSGSSAYVELRIWPLGDHEYTRLDDGAGCAGCTATGADPDTFALAADGTAYWKHGDGSLHMSPRDEPVGPSEELDFHRHRGKPCTTNVAFKHDDIAVVHRSRASAILCVGGKRRARLGNAFDFGPAGDHLVYQRRIAGVVDLFVINTKTFLPRRLDAGDETSSFRIAGTYGPAVAWASSRGPEHVLKVWRAGSPPFVLTDTDVVPESFVLSEGATPTLYWRTSDGRPHARDLLD